MGLVDESGYHAHPLLTHIWAEHWLELGDYLILGWVDDLNRTLDFSFTHQRLRAPLLFACRFQQNANRPQVSRAELSARERAV